MKKISMRTLFLLPVLLLGSSAAAQAQGGQGQTVRELRERVGLLLAGVDERDAAKVDEATCLADALHAHMSREEALGLIADAGDPALVEERRREVRTSIYAFVDRLSRRGRALLSVEASRIALFGDESEVETLPGPQGEQRPISAAGTMGVRIEGMPHRADISVYRLGERWCLDPLSMQ